MPVRIYDIAKKLGIESKAVLAKAKELGITNVRVASSSLDKITAEYLFNELAAIHKPPPVEAPAAVEPRPPPPALELPPAPPEIPLAPAAPAVPEVAVPPPTDIVPPPSQEGTPTAIAAPAQVSELPAPAAAPTPSVVPTEPSVIVPELPATTGLAAPEPATLPPAAGVQAKLGVQAPPAPSEPEAPPAPKVPRLGEKVGFIQLPTRPTSRPADKAAPPKPPARPGLLPKPGRGATRPSPALPPSRPVGRSAAPPIAPPAPAPPTSLPKFVPPTTGEVVILKPPIVVRDLADKLNQKPFKIIADLMDLGVFANVNQSVEESMAQRICAKYGFRFEVEKRERGGGLVHAPVRKVELDVDDRPEDLVVRAPVVTIMGHVDHGKTTLLDGIRKSNVVAGEAGGITQHIGAYTISIPHPERPNDLQQITFLDTPGHAAFSAMRARGANVTDIVVLVVAASEGVMPQTVEALNHAKAANVPIIVAVNKCDHPHANPLRVRQQLQERGVVCEEWGGDTIFQDISALTQKGVDKLLEMIVLQAEVLELKANPHRRAKGNVIESGLEPGGPTATVLVRKGTLRVGNVMVCSHFWGKVRALISEDGKRLKEAGPSVAVKVLGLNGVPEAGLEFDVVESDKTARLLVDERAEHAKAISRDRRPKITLENLFETLQAESLKVLRVVVKADTQGSVEAIVEALKKIDTDKVSLEIAHSAVGTITESDVLLAAASKAIVIGFHTRIDTGVTEVAKREGVQIKQYTIIYELIDEVRDAMAGLLEPESKEVVLGSAEVRQVFTLSKGGSVAGCMVTSGRITKGKVRVVRRKEVLHDGVVQTLRRFQDEVNEVRAGLECGIRVLHFDALQIGDQIECYAIEKVPQKL